MTDQPRQFCEEARPSTRSAETPAAEASLSVPLDYLQLLERCIGKIDLAHRVLRKFDQRFREDFVELEAAARAHDLQEVSRIAHRLKGSSANVSADGLHRVSKHIEQLGRSDCGEEILAQIEELRSEWQRFSEYVASPSVPIDIFSASE